ncbi:MAG: type II toxin-antitoxin system VapC family toxin [Pseudomonadota bacterium]
MIVIDTSALMAILLDEPGAEACVTVLEDRAPLVISAGTLAEALIVSRRRGLGEEMADLIAGLGIEVEAVTADRARQVAAAYDLWGKGRHAAGLNFGDCFAYALAKERGYALLYVGEDFAQTDLALER